MLESPTCPQFLLCRCSRLDGGQWIVQGRDRQGNGSHKRCCHGRRGIGHWRNSHWGTGRWRFHSCRSNGRPGYSQGLPWDRSPERSGWGDLSLVSALHGYRLWREGVSKKKKSTVKVEASPKEMGVKGWSTSSENNYANKEEPLHLLAEH